MLQDLSERLFESVTRRRFLGKLTSAAGALALTLLGVKPAYALYSTNGCNLCYNPATCSYTGCACQWSWIGLPQANGDGTSDFYKCAECYTVNPCPPDPNNACLGVKCSKATYDHTSGGGGGHGCKPSGYCY